MINFKWGYVKFYREGNIFDGILKGEMYFMKKRKKGGEEGENVARFERGLGERRSY